MGLEHKRGVEEDYTQVELQSEKLRHRLRNLDLNV